jgi:hypothetical protein
MCFGPFAIGVGGYVERGAECNVMGSAGRGVVKVVGGEGGGGWGCERGVMGVEEEGDGEGAKAAQVVDRKGD